MLTNATAALFIEEKGAGFIRAVTFLQSLPFLPLIELLLLGAPIAIHLFLGIRYVWEAKCNSFATDGSAPSLTGYVRNHLFTWQRITAVIVGLGLIAHVVTMRFLHRPVESSKTTFLVPVQPDTGLPSIAAQLGVSLDDQQGAVITKDFGTACLFLVRETFKSVVLCVAYSLFVIAASFHAANGLWTFASAWGIALNEQGRSICRRVSTMVGLALACGGLACVWMTYWVTLYS